MRKKKILVVDDDKQIQDTLTGLLEADYECVLVDNGAVGLTYLEQNPGEVDLIISELIMPVMDGFEMLDCVRNHSKNKNIPVLIITSLELKEDINRAFEIGVDDVVTKPFHPDIVKKRVNNMLEIGDNRKVHNVMEDLIRTEIEENIENLGICQCPICRKDLLTLTLNNVTPKYVSTETGAVITKAGSMASRDERIKLLAEITHYAQLVKERPRH